MIDFFLQTEPPSYSLCQSRIRLPAIHMIARGESEGQIDHAAFLPRDFLSVDFSLQFVDVAEIIFGCTKYKNDKTIEIDSAEQYGTKRSYGRNCARYSL
jgi:hypothetical protein